jgi:uncharacterized protein YlxP (DUF503 family)
MFVGLLKLEIFIGQSGSLKSKRKVIKSLKDKLRSNFNVSVSEVGHQDKWQRAAIAVACVGADKKYINGVLARINDLVAGFHQAELIDTSMEII